MGRRRRAHPRGDADDPVAVAPTTGIRLPLLPFVAAGMQLVAARTPVEHPLVLASHAVVAAWLVANVVRQTGWRRVGVGLALVGWVMNLAVMLPNGGMPVSDGAVTSLAGAGHDIVVSEGHRSKHVPMTDDTVLAPLGDVYPLPALGIVYSPGDVVLAAGLLVILAAACVPATLRSQRARTGPTELVTSSTSSPGPMGERYSSSAVPRRTGSSSTTAQ